MVLGRLLALTLGLVLLGTGLPAHAQDPVATTVTLTAEPAYADAETPLSVLLVDDTGAPVAGAPVRLERRVDGTWTPVATLTTDETGAATVGQVLARRARDNDFRAFYDGDTISYAASESGVVRADLVKRKGVVTLGGPRTVVDEESVELRVRWRTANGTPIEGRLLLRRKDRGGEWTTFRRIRTDADGRASLDVRPRVDTKWRATGPGLDWVRRDVSPVHRIDNLPPGVPVSLPSAAPKPRVRLPKQSRATGDGANPKVTAIPTSVWNQMTGRSYHQGCPVGRASLRLLRINYWGYDGYRYRGELVARTDAVDNMRGALTAMYDQQLPIRSMYRVDRFGWSSRLRGADDYRSMAAGNTSAFNCRDVVGRPGVRSPHSYGRSLDINTWENPYRSSGGWVPNGWWVTRSHDRVAWRSREHAVVKIMLAHGLRWTYGTQDAHHFDVPASSGRVVTARARACGDEVCH